MLFAGLPFLHKEEQQHGDRRRHQEQQDGHRRRAAGICTLTKKGNLAVGSGFNDDPLWLIAGTDAYLRKTGDWTILDAPTFGEGKNSWLTGTAAWTFVSISQAILGVQPTLEGLAIDPCIPTEWAGYTVKRRYRGAVYRITVENPYHAEKGIVSLTVNGTPVTGNVLPPAAPGTEVQVRVVMG